MDAIVTYSIVLTTDGVEPPEFNPRVDDAVDANALVAVVISPKSIAFPNVAIVIYSIPLRLVGVEPPITNPRVELEHPVVYEPLNVNSPK